MRLQILVKFDLLSPPPHEETGFAPLGAGVRGLRVSWRSPQEPGSAEQSPLVGSWYTAPVGVRGKKPPDLKKYCFKVNFVNL